MSVKRILTFFLLILALSLISIYYNPASTGQAIKQTDYPPEEATLERVVYGDTIEARVNNETWKIRLLGINNLKV